MSLVGHIKKKSLILIGNLVRSSIEDAIEARDKEWAKELNDLGYVRTADEIKKRLKNKDK